MSSIVVDYPVRPITEMPQDVQSIVLYVGAALLALVFIYAARRAMQYRSPLPILCVLGGICAVAIEAIACNLGQAYHAQVGQISAFKTLDREIPLHMFLIYGVYFGAMPVFLYSRMVERTLNGAFLFKTYLACVVFAYLFEVIPVSTGLWAYYGNQAMWVWEGSLPLYWALTNPAVAIVPTVLIYLALPYLRGVKQLLVIPLTISGVAMGFLGSSWLWIIAANSTWGPLAVNLAAIGSVLLAVMLVWLLGCVIDAEKAPKHTRIGLPGEVEPKLYPAGDLSKTARG